MKLHSIWLLTLLALPPSAHAGSEAHGGDVLVCPGKAPVVLDYYYAAMPSPTNPQGGIVDISSMSAQQVINFVRRRIGNSYFGTQFERVYAMIGDISLWALAEGLEDIADDGSQVKYPMGCSLVQGAVRSGMGVYVDRQVAQQLSPSQIGILALHEVFYYLAVGQGRSTSATVRPAIRAILQERPKMAAFAAAVKDMGWDYSLLGKMSGGLYNPFPWGETAFAILYQNAQNKELWLNFFKSFIGLKEDNTVVKFRCDEGGTCVPASPIGNLIEGTYLRLLEVGRIEISIPGKEVSIFKLAGTR